MSALIDCIFWHNEALSRSSRSWSTRISYDLWPTGKLSRQRAALGQCFARHLRMRAGKGTFHEFHLSVVSRGKWQDRFERALVCVHAYLMEWSIFNLNSSSARISQLEPTSWTVMSCVQVMTFVWKFLHLPPAFAKSNSCNFAAVTTRDR